MNEEPFSLILPCRQNTTSDLGRFTPWHSCFLTTGHTGGHTCVCGLWWLDEQGDCGCLCGAVFDTFKDWADHAH